MSFMLVLTLLACLLTWPMQFQTYDVRPSESFKNRGSKDSSEGGGQHGGSYLAALAFAPNLSASERQLNTEILQAAYRYTSKTENIPNVDATAMYFVAATSQENQGAGDPNVFANVRMTTDIYENNHNALQSFSHNNTYGLEGYSGSYVGPLSLANHFLGKAVDPVENGRIGALSNARYDKSGTIGDRYNWYDTCNMAAQHLDKAWGYFYDGGHGRQVDEDNIYAVVAITAMSMHQGSSVLQEDDDFMPYGQAENATPQFWFDWCNLLANEKYIETIRNYVTTYKPDSYNNDKTINEQLIIPLMRTLKEDALKENPNFFSYSRFQARSSWVNGYDGYSSFVGSGGEKTSAAVKVLVSYIIMEERYKGNW